MPAKRNNTQTGAVRKTAGKEKTDPTLQLILKRLDTFEQRFDAIEQKVGTLRQEIQADVTRSSDALRQEIQSEITRSSDSLRQEIKNDMAQGFASFRVEMKADMQKEFEKHGAGIHQHFSRVENELKAEMAELRDNQRKLLTGLDAAARDYDEYRRDRVLSDKMLYDLKHDVEELKKRDMEKAAAIDKIEKQLKAA